MNDMFDVVPSEVMQVFENHDMQVYGFQRNGHVLYFEIKGYTDAGGDMTHIIAVNDDELDNLPSWREGFYTEMNYFDPWEEAFKWCNEFGQPQNCPFDNGADLYKDIEDYKNDVLQAVYDDLMEL